MTEGGGDLFDLPDGVLRTLDDFRDRLALDLRVWQQTGDGPTLLYPNSGTPAGDGPDDDAWRGGLQPRGGPPLQIEIRRGDSTDPEGPGQLLLSTLERTFDSEQEIRFFTFELSERYEEINLLYSISETLGSVLRLQEAARIILGEVCDVLGARRGSLWVHIPESDQLDLVASVGDEGRIGPLRIDDPRAVTAEVFRKGRPMLGSESDADGDRMTDFALADLDSFLSVPIRYTPPEGEPRTVGVINLFGRRNDSPFTASDQRLLSAIASQVGSALENNRLIRESLAQERMAREMELAHNLQMKLLPTVEGFEGFDVAARVEPAEQVGGDFYHLFKLPRGRVGVMIGDVSSHGFPAALIMALTMSAASIYATEVGTPGRALRHLDDSLADELETTEMYLSLFFGVIDPEAATLTYANAGHPHAFVVRAGGEVDRIAALDPPVGFAGPDAYREEVVPWNRDGDLLLCFTDGLSDMLAIGERGSGELRILDEVVRRRKEPAAGIVGALFDLALANRPTIPSDDRTAIVVRT